MDHDVYLILLGAGISLASSIVTLILQFIFSQWNEKIRFKREEKQKRSREIRNALLDKSLPTRALANKILGKIFDRDNQDETILIERNTFYSPPLENSNPRTPTERFWAKYGKAIKVGLNVFIVWIIYFYLLR